MGLHESRNPGCCSQLESTPYAPPRTSNPPLDEPLHGLAPINMYTVHHIVSSKTSVPCENTNGEDRLWFPLSALPCRVVLPCGSVLCLSFGLERRVRHSSLRIPVQPAGWGVGTFAFLFPFSFFFPLPLPGRQSTLGSKGIVRVGVVVWSTKASHAMQANKSSATFRGAKAGQGSHKNPL